MGRLSRIITVAGGILLLGAIGFLVFPIFHAGRTQWPKINDYELLLSDATILTQQRTAGLVDTAEWPSSIRELSPRLVRVDTDLVEIVISTGGINPGWGFHIYTGATLDPQRVRHPNVTPTVHPRVYRWTTIE
jgi:hypothetical protein